MPPHKKYTTKDSINKRAAVSVGWAARLLYNQRKAFLQFGLLVRLGGGDENRTIDRGRCCRDALHPCCFVRGWRGKSPLPGHSQIPTLQLPLAEDHRGASKARKPERWEFSACAGG